MLSCGSGTGVKACGSGAQCHCAGGAAPAWGQGRGAAGVTLALFLPPQSPSPVLHLPCSLPSIFHALEALFSPFSAPPAPLACQQQWAAQWGPGGRGAGAAPRAGLAARPAAARSPFHPGTEGSPVPTLSSAAAAWGSTRPAGWPKVTRVPRGCPPPSCVTVPRCCRPRCLSQHVFNHPCVSPGCSSARGGQDTT